MGIRHLNPHKIRSRSVDFPITSVCEVRQGLFHVISPEMTGHRPLPIPATIEYNLMKTIVRLKEPEII